MGVKRVPYQIVEREMVDGNWVWATQDDLEFYSPDGALLKARKLAKDLKPGDDPIRIHRDGQPWCWIYASGTEEYASAKGPKRRAA